MSQEGFAASLIGKTIGGDFVPIAQRGSGGMGVVFEATQLSLDRRVALKVLRPGLPLPGAGARFVNEGRAMARVVHENVVTVHMAGEEGDLAFIAMELLEGRSLDELVVGGVPGLREAIEIAEQAASGVAAAHANGIAHRDLKPSNVFLREVRGPARVKVLDFGIAKVIGQDDGPMTQSGHVLGTYAYLPPERIEDPDEASPLLGDVYALGVVLFEMLAGRRPFEGTHVQLLYNIVNKATPRLSDVCLRPVPIALEELVHATLEKRPENRPQTMLEVRDALGEILKMKASGGLEAPPMPRKKARRGPPPPPPPTTQGADSVAPFDSPEVQPSSSSVPTAFGLPTGHGASDHTRESTASVPARSSRGRRLWVWGLSAIVGFGALGAALATVLSTPRHGSQDVIRVPTRGELDVIGGPAAPAAPGGRIIDPPGLVDLPPAPESEVSGTGGSRRQDDLRILSSRKLARASARSLAEAVTARLAQMPPSHLPGCLVSGDPAASSSGCRAGGRWAPRRATPCTWYSERGEPSTDGLDWSKAPKDPRAELSYRVDMVVLDTDEGLLAKVFVCWRDRRGTVREVSANVELGRRSATAPSTPPTPSKSERPAVKRKPASPERRSERRSERKVTSSKSDTLEVRLAAPMGSAIYEMVGNSPRMVGYPPLSGVSMTRGVHEFSVRRHGVELLRRRVKIETSGQLVELFE